MSDLIPSPYALILLTLGAFRVVRIIGWDSISEPARKWLTGYTDKGAPSITDKQRAAHGRLRVYVSTLIRCPWCIGTYVCTGVYLLWLWLPIGTLVACVPLTIGALIGLIAKSLDA